MKSQFNKEKKELLSIITCVYNGENYIQKLFDSVLAQNYPEIEHIVINDGSTDNTSKIINKYKNKYESRGYKLIEIYEKNKGLGSATNVGLKNITGEFWTWINCDDWFLPNAIEKSLNLLKGKNIDVLFINRFDVDEINQKKQLKISNSQHCFRTNKQIKRKYYNGQFPNMHFLIKTNSFKQINPKMEIDPLKYTQDVQLQGQIIPFLKVGFCKEPLVCFLKRKDALNNKNKCVPNYLDLTNNAILNSISLLNVSEEDKEISKVITINNHYCILRNHFLDQNVNEFNQKAKEIKNNLKQTNISKKYRKYLPKEKTINYLSLIICKNFLQKFYKFIYFHIIARF